MAFQYKVVPFRGHAKGGLNATDVAKQLETIIQQHAAQGWEFCQLSDVNIEVQPGCIAGLFGAEVQYARFDQVIFRAPDVRLSEVGSNTIASKDTAAPAQLGQPVRPAHAAGWTCSCGHVNPLEMARCSECRKWRAFTER